MRKPITSKYWAFEYIKGLLRDCVPILNHSKIEYSKDSVAVYFNKISEKYYSKNHEASNDSLICYYLSSNEYLNNALSIDNPVIYDLGAGYGDIYKCIDFPINSNINLVDFSENSLSIARNSLNHISNVNVTLCDLREWEPDTDDANIILCINVISYIENIDLVFKSVSQTMKKDGVFVLLYPTRSPVWEDSFEGVKSIYHDSEYISDIFVELGVICIQDIDISFNFPLPFNFINKSIGKLSIFRKL